MIFFLFLAAVLWGVGAVTGAPRKARWAMIGVLYVAVIISVVALGEASPFGGTLGEWLLVGGLAGVVIAYRAVLAKLRRKVQGTEDASADTGPKPTFRDAELERYMRHIVLHEIGGVGQKKLKDARVLVIGAGGLGAPVLQYLAAAGVGTIGVVDDDVVDASNLQRQVIHTDARIGMPKVFSAEIAMREQNPFIDVKPYNRRFEEDCAPLLDEYDLVIDGSDNFDTRYLVNRLSVAAQTPLLAAAITQWEGQISTYNSAPDAPCYQCVFPERPADGMVPSCAEAGVAAPLPGMLGTMLAMEAVKEITGAGQGLTGRIVIVDALYGENRSMRVKKRGDCPICAR